jgi:DNA-binding transcriptional MocR family regulator
VAYLRNNWSDVVDYHRARRSGRRISTAAAESVMNHVINRRMSKKQQMRWSINGAHRLLQTRVALLDNRLEAHFHARHPHFRSPEVRGA